MPNGHDPLPESVCCSLATEPLERGTIQRRNGGGDRSRTGSRFTSSAYLDGRQVAPATILQGAAIIVCAQPAQPDNDNQSSSSMGLVVLLD